MHMYDVSYKKVNLSMCMYDVINKKAKLRRQKHKNVVLIVTRAKTRARYRNVCGVRAHVADVVRQEHAPGERVGDDDKADDYCDDYCYGVQILGFEPFRTQIQNTN